VLCAFAVATSATAINDALGRRHLSPLLRAGADVLGPSKVGPLPGINATSYSGYFEVNATDHASLFFWLWPALNGNASAPLDWAAFRHQDGDALSVGLQGSAHIGGLAFHEPSGALLLMFDKAKPPTVRAWAPRGQLRSRVIGRPCGLGGVRGCMSGWATSWGPRICS
jgi:hypothetical protein